MINKIKNISIIVLIGLLVFWIWNSITERSRNIKLENENKVLKQDTADKIKLWEIKLKDKETNIDKKNKEIDGLNKRLVTADNYTKHIKPLKEKEIAKLKGLNESCNVKIDKLVTKYNTDIANLKISLSLKDQIIFKKDQIILELNGIVIESKDLINSLRLNLKKKDAIIDKSLRKYSLLKLNGPGIVYADKVRVSYASINIDLLELIRIIF